MQIIGKLVVECAQCGEQYTFTKGDADFESQGDERSGMGTEITYTWSHEFECEECPNEISFECSVSEYPKGMRDDRDVSIDGAKVLSQFDYTFDEPDYDED